jgi:hypothetical protein
MTCPWNGQIRNLPRARFQIALVVPIALISTLLVALIRQRPNKGSDFLF